MVSSPRPNRGGESPRSLRDDAVAPKSPPKHEAEAGEEDSGHKEDAKEDKGEKEYHGGQIAFLAGEGRPAVLWWVADIIDRPLRCIEAPSWARRDVDEGSGRHPGADR